MKIKSRRDFLRAVVHGGGALGAMSAFGPMAALASSGSGYQALVCVFLAGGNDGHNTVVPIATAQQGYSVYQQARKSLALPQNQLLPISSNGDSYGLHPALSEIQALYNGGQAAVLANVGNLVQPLNRQSYLTNNSAIIPTALFSHSDQTSQWQSASPTGTLPTGWGGRIMDLLQPQNSGSVFPPMTSTGGCGIFCSGAQVFPATVPPSGMAMLDSHAAGASGASAQTQLLSFDNGMTLVQAANSILTRGNQYATTLSGLLASSNLQTTFPANNPLAAQLKTVAQIMSVRNSLGLTRQIFFCQLGGFDTHSDQTETQALLLGQLSKAVDAFYKATQELGIESSVTTFTASEFGRTLQPSGTDGSDHAWGSHHFIIGGSVLGGKIYGTFPQLVLGSSQDATGRGSLIPTSAVAQYGATLAGWFGVDSGSMAGIFPNIGNFGSANLGFLG
ncbi:MAG TPA: DUF1501 domain-containing protein [Nevskiaceae bacterium]|nr:DUF1501 domain-containing protein [Nevskiaceae bacterium]